MSPKGGSYKNIDLDKRRKIESLIKADFSLREIAKSIGVSRSTIYREISRCELNKYSAEVAQKHKIGVYKEMAIKISRENVSIEARLTNIEFQLEILTENIREIMKHGLN